VRPACFLSPAIACAKTRHGKICGGLLTRRDFKLQFKLQIHGVALAERRYWV